MLHTSHYQFAGGFTVEEERRIGVLVGSSITMGSSDDYSRHWKKWLDFLGTIEVERRPQEYLEDVGEVGAKVKWLVLFIDYLKNVVRTQDVGGVLSGVKFQWKRRCLDCDFFKNGAVAQAKQGARLTTDQIRETALRKERTKILPAIVEMVIYLRDKLWRQSGVDRMGLDQKGAYMAPMQCDLERRTKGRGSLRSSSPLPVLGRIGKGEDEAERRGGDPSLLNGGLVWAHGECVVRRHHGLHWQESEQSLLLSTGENDRERESVRGGSVGGHPRMDGNQRSQGRG